MWSNRNELSFEALYAPPYFNNEKQFNSFMDDTKNGAWN